MIFQHTIDKVLSGEKTQTRRLVKPGCHEYQSGWDVIRATVDKRGLTHTKLWTVGSTYAIQPGRGKAAVARMRITDIRRQDVREISAADAKAEGFKTASEFFITWVKMHDKSVIVPIIPDYNTGLITWQGVREQLSQRPAERYQAWALTFEVVK